ncbi:MAG: qor [Chthonomonadales bacterium]|nr:qor [Chthonomonadales bacterium]
MKAIRVDAYGGPEVLRLQEVETPQPGPGQARISVAAAGLNFVDIYIRRGEYTTLTPPYIPGFEGAGIVDAIGEGVQTVKVGDRVAYTGQPGAYAEAQVVQADSLLPLPPELTFEQGAAIPLQGLTAHYLLHEYRQIQPGETVLIHAAAGGMGLLLVQWARHLGARVVGTVSTEQKAQAAKEAGADHLILYTQQDWVAETKRLTDGVGAHLIIDGVGKTTFAGNLEAAALRGNIVLYGAASGSADPFAPNILQRRSLTVSGGMLGNYTQTREELLRRAKDLMDGISEGWLKLHIHQALPLAEAAAAHRLLEDRQSIGKIVLTTR